MPMCIATALKSPKAISSGSFCVQNLWLFFSPHSEPTNEITHHLLSSPFLRSSRLFNSVVNHHNSGHKQQENTHRCIETLSWPSHFQQGN